MVIWHIFGDQGGKKSLNVDTLRMRGGMMHDVKKTSNGTKMCGRHDSLTMAPTLYVAAGVSVWLQGSAAYTRP